MATLFLAQRYLSVKLDGIKHAEKREAIRDAMCLALWAVRTKHKKPPN